MHVHNIGMPVAPCGLCTYVPSEIEVHHTEVPTFLSCNTIRCISAAKLDCSCLYGLRSAFVNGW